MINSHSFLRFTKASRDVLSLPLVPIDRALGRPRNVLEVGRGSAVPPRKDGGPRVVNADELRENAAGGASFDVVLFSGPPGEAGLDKLLAGHLSRLAPEGHVVIRVRLPKRGRRSEGAGTGAPFDVDEARRAVEAADLEFLRIEGPLRLAAWGHSNGAGQSFLVARRRPRPGPLSLTVGMLTMNEEESISRMMDEIRRVAPDAQILCVDSSNKDQTHVIAERMGARVLRQLPPRGHGPAMELLMYEAAAQSDALVYLDCDFTYPPDLIPTVRRVLEQGVDVVNAARTRTRPAAMPLLNYFANKSFALTARGLYGVPANDLHSGMRGYRSSVIRAFSFDGEGDALPIDTLLWPARCGYDVVEIPLDYQERVGISKLRKVAGTMWTLIRLGKTFAVGERRSVGYRVLERPES